MLLECQQNKHLAQTFSGFWYTKHQEAKWQPKIKEEPPASRENKGKQPDSREEMT
jgi:hypothetical protein